MPARFVDNWDRIKERHIAWWQGEGFLLQIFAPRKPMQYPPAKDPYQYWADPEYVVGRWEEYFASTYFLGDAFPCLFVNLGPSIASVYLGCPLVLQNDTTWQEPIIKDVEGLLTLHFDQQNEWWQRTLEIISLACQRSQGEYIVSFTDLGGISDILSHLRGPAQLCVDMLEHPDIIRKAGEWVADFWLKLYEEQYEILKRYQEGTCGWLPVWAPGKSYPLQEDFSCMISPEMFRGFFLPHLKRQTEFLAYSLYHLDGPGAIKHLASLLGLPRLHAIQWVPGAGAPPMREWIPLLKRIQGAKRGLVLDITPEEVEPLLSALDLRGLCLRTWCSSKEEGEELLRIAEKIAN